MGADDVDVFDVAAIQQRLQPAQTPDEVLHLLRDDGLVLAAQRRVRRCRACAGFRAPSWSSIQARTSWRWSANSSRSRSGWRPSCSTTAARMRSVNARSTAPVFDTPFATPFAAPFARTVMTRPARA